MDTVLMQAGPEALAAAQQALQTGQVVGIPTETVYGLAANGLDGAAVRRIFAAKSRPADNPLILHVAQLQQALQLFEQVEDTALRLMEAFWPGPFTIVLPAKAHVPAEVRAGLPTVAVRCPQHIWLRQLIDLCGFPLAAPSANLSGKPSPTTALSVWEDMNGRIPLIVDGGDCTVGVESTVVAVHNGCVRLLRPGGVSLEQLRAVAENVVVDDGVLNPVQAEGPVASPGMKYRHYAPEGQVTLYEGAPEAVQAAICAAYARAEKAGGRPVVITCIGQGQYHGLRTYHAGKDAAEYARHIFTLLRRADTEACTHILAEMPEETGMGLAVYNRMLRAAGFRIIKV